MKKKAAGLEALKQTIPEAAPEQKIEELPTPKQSTKKEKVIFSLHIPTQAHEKLRELSFFERTSMTKILLEGLDAVFEKRGVKASKE